MSKRALPWMMFFPADWLADAVHGCTPAARDIWMDILCVMHGSPRYGYLESEGKPIPDELMFRRCGCASVEEYRNLLAELFAAGSQAVPRKELSTTGVWSAISKSETRPLKGKGNTAVTPLSHPCHREKSEVKVISQNQRKSKSLRRRVTYDFD